MRRRDADEDDDAPMAACVRARARARARTGERGARASTCAEARRPPARGGRWLEVYTDTATYRLVCVLCATAATAATVCVEIIFRCCSIRRPAVGGVLVLRSHRSLSRRRSRRRPRRPRPRSRRPRRRRRPDTCRSDKSSRGHTRR